MPTPMLVPPSWLAERLESADTRIVDGSWYLPSAARNARAEYDAAHIPGAVFLDLATDLADPAAPIRNTLADPARLARSFARSGISNAHHVVIYDHLGGYSAARIWWTLRYLGHERVSLLDGGMVRWQSEGHPVSDAPVQHSQARFEAHTEPRWLVTRADVLAHLDDPAVRIVDARARGRFLGLEPETTPRRGHIPGARNVPYDANLAGDPPQLRPLQELAELYRSVGVTPDRRVITSCGSGVTAALSAFAMTLLGYPNVAVYDGSWAEWGASPDVPVVLEPAATESA